LHFVWISEWLELKSFVYCFVRKTRVPSISEMLFKHFRYVCLNAVPLKNQIYVLSYSSQLTTLHNTQVITTENAFWLSSNYSSIVIAQVWSVNGQEKVLIPAADQSKFYSGGCYIFQYSYPGEDREEYLIGTWFGKKSVKVNFRHPILTCPPISFWACGAVTNTLGTCHNRSGAF